MAVGHPAAAATPDHATRRTPPSAPEGSIRPLLVAEVVVPSVVLLALAERTNPDWAWLNTLQLTTSAIAVILSVTLAQIGRARPAMWIAAGSVVWWCADLTGMAFGALGLVETNHRIFETMYLVGQALWMASAYAAIERRRQHSPIRHVADAALFALLVEFVLYTAVEHDTLRHSGDWYAMATLAVDGAYLTFAYLAARSIAPPFRGPYQVMAGSAAILLVTDVTFLFGVLQGTPLNAWITDTGWSIATIVRCVGLVLIGRVVRRGTVGVETRLRPPRLLVPLVILAFAVATTSEPVTRWSLLRQVIGGAMLLLAVAREAFVWFHLRDLEASEHAARTHLEHKARHDDLTGLLRRGQIFEQLDLRLAAGHPLAVAYVDLNDFSSVNDSFGHAVGDRVLEAVATRLAGAGADIVGRIGGDEFVLLNRLDVAPLGRDGRDLHDRVAAALAEPLDIGGGATIKIVPSIGVAVTDGIERPTPGELIARADHLAYTAKSDFGRSRSAKHKMATPRVDVAALEAPLRALRDGRFDVWFQPIMDLRTGHIAGAEALIRMIDDDGTVRAAGSFVPALQAAGYAEDITRAVIAAALPAFASAEVTERGWYLTLNLSERDLANPSIIDLLADGIRRSGVDPTRLVVEVSEQVDPNGALLHAVESVRELGVGIALDDFGAGSSTFGQIAGLSPSVLKLDIGLLPVIGPAPSGLQSAELVDAFTRLAHHLNMTVVAEGVESEEQRRILEGLGCDHAQGYLWSPAVPLADLLAMAAEETTAPLRTGTDG